MKTIAISTTVPLEILLLSGAKISDLNNRFVTSSSPAQMILEAERQGFPRSLCAWIKGLYTACLELKPDIFVAVTEGDCSNTKGLNALLAHKGITTITFGYAQSRTLASVEQSLASFAKKLGVDLKDAEALRKALYPVRQLGRELDQLTYETLQVSGFENHLWLVNFSDFEGDLENFTRRLSDFVTQAKTRPRQTAAIKLGYVGVPPMTADLYDYVASQGAPIVFNEVQRQFSMPHFDQVDSLAEQYATYTYPYDLQPRLEDIRQAIVQRELDGIIHYTQAFCHRALDDLLIKEGLSIPVLTIEGDQATQLDARTKLRLEAFLEMLKEHKGGL